MFTKVDYKFIYNRRGKKDKNGNRTGKLDKDGKAPVTLVAYLNPHRLYFLTGFRDCFGFIIY